MRTQLSLLALCLLCHTASGKTAPPEDCEGYPSGTQCSLSGQSGTGTCAPGRCYKIFDAGASVTDTGEDASPRSFVADVDCMVCEKSVADSGVPAEAGQASDDLHGGGCSTSSGSPRGSVAIAVALMIAALRKRQNRR